MSDSERVTSQSGETWGNEATGSSELGAIERLLNGEEHKTELQIARAIFKMRSAVTNRRFGVVGEGEPDNKYLAVVKGEENPDGSYVDVKCHRPVKPLNQLAIGEQASWSFWPAHDSSQRWLGIRGRLRGYLNSAAPVTAGLVELIDEIRSEERVKVALAEREFKSANNLSEFDSLVASSGSAMINELMNILAKRDGEKLSVSIADQNGSEIEAKIKSEGEFDAITLLDQTGEPRPHADVLADYKRQIEDGSRYVVVPLVSKRADMYSDLVRGLLDYRQKNPDKKFFLMVDAIQANGRLPSTDILGLLREAGVDGITITGGKAAGGEPHGAICLLTQSGKDQIEENLADRMDIKNIGGKLLDGYEGLEIDDLLRIQGNLQSITDLYSKEKSGQPLYGDAIAGLRESLTDAFAVLGDPATGTVNSVLTFPHSGTGLSGDRIHVFLTELAKGGISMCGSPETYLRFNIALGSLDIPIDQIDTFANAMKDVVDRAHGKALQSG